MDSGVMDLRDIDLTQVAVVGGKGARLGELTRIDGVRVPAGFCVTTDAFPRWMGVQSPVACETTAALQQILAVLETGLRA